MRLAALIFAAILVAADGAAQQPAASPSDTSTTPPATPAQDLPVSLDRIREALKKAPDVPLLQGLDREADFRIEVREKAKLDDILKKLDFRTGPAPAGGLYGYEQQQRLFSSVDRPLMQPYAAFSGGELITIAIENLIGRYLAKPLMKSLANAVQAREERAAKEEVDRNVEAYCASRPDRHAITLCNPER